MHSIGPILITNSDQFVISRLRENYKPRLGRRGPDTLVNMLMWLAVLGEAPAMVDYISIKLAF